MLASREGRRDHSVAETCTMFTPVSYAATRFLLNQPQLNAAQAEPLFNPLSPHVIRDPYPSYPPMAKRWSSASAVTAKLLRVF